MYMYSMWCFIKITIFYFVEHLVLISLHVHILYLFNAFTNLKRYSILDLRSPRAENIKFTKWKYITNQDGMQAVPLINHCVEIKNNNIVHQIHTHCINPWILHVYLTVKGQKRGRWGGGNKNVLTVNSYICTCDHHRWSKLTLVFTPMFWGKLYSYTPFP